MHLGHSSLAFFSRHSFPMQVLMAGEEAGGGWSSAQWRGRNSGEGRRTKRKKRRSMRYTVLTELKTALPQVDPINRYQLTWERKNQGRECGSGGSNQSI